MMSLFNMKQFLKCYPKSIFVSYFTDSQTEGNISPTQLKLQYNIGVTIQDNAAQDNDGGTVPTILALNAISNTGKIAKM